MINEERVALMTHLAQFDEKEAGQCAALSRYFHGDYVLLEVVKAAFYATVSFGMLLGIYLLYNMEELMESMYELDLFAMASSLLAAYGKLVLLYCIIALLVSTFRHLRAQKKIRKYYQNLKKLNNMYYK